MAAKTLHIYPFDGAWAVKKEGKSAKTFSTRQKAVSAAKERLKKEGSGQFVVHGEDGGIREYGTYRMPRIHENPKKSPLAAQIELVVGKMALERAKSGPGDHAYKK